MRIFEKADLLAADDLNDMVDNINRALGSPTSTEYAGSGGSMYGLKRKPLRYPNWQKISFTRSIQSKPLVVRKGNICFDYPVATIYPVVETTLTLTGSADVYVYVFWSRTAPATNGVTFTSDVATLESTTSEARFPLAKYEYISEFDLFQIKENYWQGGDIYVDRIEIDNISIDANASKQAQVGGWADTDAVSPATDGVEYFGRKTKGGAYEYSTLDGIVKNPKNANAIAKAINDGGAGSTINNINFSENMPHHNDLSNLNDNPEGLKYNHTIFLYQNGTASAGLTHNQCAGISSVAGNKYINLDSGLLHDGTNTALNWVLKFLQGGDWTLKDAGNHLIIEGTANGSAGAGALQVAGGGSFGKKLYIADLSPVSGGVGALTCLGGGYFGLGVKGDSNAGDPGGKFGDGTRNVDLGTGTYAVNATNGAINANATSGFSVTGTKVVGAQATAVADSTGLTDVVAQLNDLLGKLRTHGLIAT